MTARDLAQEVFIKAYLGLKSFRFASTFSTWILRITLNTTNNYFSSRHYKEREASLPFQAEMHGQTAEDVPQFNEGLLAHLQSGIASLRPKLRDVVVLCGLENKSYEETAQILGIPAGTVASTGHSFRESL